MWRNKLQLYMCKDNTTVGVHIFQIFSLFDLPFFHIFHIISHFNLPFFHIFHIISQFNLAFFHIFHIISLFNWFFFHTFQILSLFNFLFFHKENCEKIWKIWKLWKKSIFFHKTINTACNLSKFTLCLTVRGNNSVFEGTEL
jgi:hypothetical protein